MSVLRNLSRNKTLMVIFKVLLALVLIGSVYMIGKNYHSKMVNVEHFSSFDSKDTPLQYSINGLLSVASGNFQHSTLKMELDSKISSNNQSLITLESLHDEDTNTVISFDSNPFSRSPLPLRSSQVLRQQSGKGDTSSGTATSTQSKGDGGWLNLDFSNLSSKRVKTCLWVAYSNDVIGPQAYQSPKFVNDQGLFVFEVDGVVSRPKIRLLREHQIENHNDNEEKIVWKLLETEIDLSDSQKISWRLGPVPEDEKGYRYLTGLRIYPIHEKLQDYPYPVGLQGFLHSNHPQTSNSPALTWRDLSQHHRDFVWSPDFPKKQKDSIKNFHLNLNTESSFGLRELQPFTLVMKFTRHDRYNKAVVFEALKPNGKIWLKIELTDDESELQGLVTSEDATHQYYTRFTVPSQDTQTLVFLWNPETHVLRVRVPDSTFKHDSRPDFFIKGMIDTQNGSKGLKINSQAGGLHGWDVNLEYFFWYDRELDNSEIHSTNPDNVGGGKKIEGFTNPGESVFRAADRQTGQTISQGGGTNDTSNCSVVRPHPESDTSCQVSSRYNPTAQNETYTPEGFKALLEEEITTLEAHQNSLPIQESDELEGVNDSLRIGFIRSQFDKRRRQLQADISERRFKIVELTAQITGEPVSVGIAMANGSTDPDAITRYTYNSNDVLPDSEFDRYRETHEDPETDTDGKSCQAQGYIKRDEIPCYGCDMNSSDTATATTCQPQPEFCSLLENDHKTCTLENGQEGWCQDSSCVGVVKLTESVGTSQPTMVLGVTHVPYGWDTPTSETPLRLEIVNGDKSEDFRATGVSTIKEHGHSHIIIEPQTFQNRFAVGSAVRIYKEPQFQPPPLPPPSTMQREAVKAAVIHHVENSGGGGGMAYSHNISNGNDNLLGNNNKTFNNYDDSFSRYGSGLI